MAYTDLTKLENNQRDQLACSLAALLLHDEGSDVTADSLKKVLKAANITVAAYWPTLLGKSLEGKNVGDYLKVSGGGAAPTQGAAPAQGNAPAKKEEAPAPVEEEEDVDMDMGDLFG